MENKIKLTKKEKQVLYRIHGEMAVVDQENFPEFPNLESKEIANAITKLNEFKIIALDSENQMWQTTELGDQYILDNDFEEIAKEFNDNLMNGGNINIKKLYIWIELDYYNNKLKNLDIKDLKDSLFKILFDLKVDKAYENYLNSKEKDEFWEKGIFKINTNMNIWKAELYKAFKSYLSNHKILPIPKSELNANIIISNILLLFFIESQIKRITSIKEFILQFSEKDFMFYCSPIKTRNPSYVKKGLYKLHFLALKWFYSEETKHIYSEELLKEMKEYEEQIKDTKWENCTRKPSKFDRLKI